MPVVDWENDFRNARLDRTKIVDYLLDAATPRGAAKSRFFRSIGFVPSRWEELAAALRSQARGARLREVSTPWGLKVIAVGPLDAPNGRRYKITTVWIVEASRTRLVTAYPQPGSKP